MLLENIVTFDILSYYDGKIKAWVKALRPTETQYYVEGDALPDGKSIGDVKTEGHGGIITYAEWLKLTNMIGINGLKLNLTGDAATVNADSNGVYTIDVTSKADKVAAATAGNFAGLDANGNITDSGSKASDFATAELGGFADSALQEVVNGTDGTYVTTTIGAKAGLNGAKSQTIAVGVTIQSLSTADASHQGLAEASDVKNYVDNLVSAGINYKGSVRNYSALPANPAAGDMYNVKEGQTVSGEFYPGDMNYIWAGAIGEAGQDGYVAAHWDPQSPIINLSSATTAQIDGLF